MRPGVPRRLFHYTLYLGLALGTLETAKAMLVAEARGIDFAAWRALVTNMSWWLLWVPLAQVVFWIEARASSRPGKVRRLATHVVGCTLVTLVHLSASAVLVRVGAAPPPGLANTIGRHFGNLLAGYLLTDFITYGVALAGFVSLMAAQRTRAAEEARAALELAAASAEAERSRMESLVTLAKLRALRSELDPHFLYNSLNSVSALVRQGDRAGAVRMIAMIGDLLRLTLDGREESETSLGEEIALLRVYLGIEAVRFADRLVTVWRVPRILEGALVPPLILQPIVENSIRHGLSRVEHPVTVELEAHAEGETLLIRVRDTGPGPAAPHGSHEPGTGVGLQNVAQRVSAMYGPGATVTLRSPPSGGAETTVTLPLRLPRIAERSA